MRGAIKRVATDYDQSAERIWRMRAREGRQHGDAARRICAEQRAAARTAALRRDPVEISVRRLHQLRLRILWAVIKRVEHLDFCLGHSQGQQ